MFKLIVELSKAIDVELKREIALEYRVALMTTKTAIKTLAVFW